MAGSLVRSQIASALQRMIRYRPCKFTVEHTVLVTRNGGQQGDPQTFGPYRGVITAPGSGVGTTMTGLSRVTSAGAMTNQMNWLLLTPPNAKVSFGSNATDWITVEGFSSRFRVKSVRPIADIVPPVGLLIGMDEQT